MVFDTRRASSPAPDDDRPPIVSADHLSLAYPLVWKFLTLTVYGDGSRREPGSVSIFFDAGVVKACANDKDASLAAFVSGDGLAGVLESLEVGLREDRLDWRPSKKRKYGKG